MSFTDDVRLESIDRLIETEIGGSYPIIEELEKLNSCLMEKKLHPRKPAIKEIAHADDFESETSRDCSPRSMISTHANLTVTDVYDKERRQQLKKCLKPINQTLLFMGNQESRRLLTLEPHSRRESVNKSKHRESDSSFSFLESKKGAAPVRKASPSPSASIMTQSHIQGPGSKSLINFAEYVSNVQKKMKQKKTPRERSKRGNYTKKQNKDVFEMEEICQENHIQQKQSIQSDILKDKNIKFDYSESLRVGGESKNTESYYDMVEFEAHNKKYDSIRGDSEDQLDQSIQQSCISQHHEQNRSRSISVRTGKLSIKHVHFKKRLDSSIKEKNTISHQKNSQSREIQKSELIISRRASMQCKDTDKVPVERVDFKNTGLIHIPVGVSNIPESQSFQEKEIYDRFLEIQLTEIGTEDSKYHQHPLSAEKMYRRPQEDESEVDRVFFRPLLTKKSLQIASKMGDPADRLLANVSVKKRKIEESVRHKMSFDCTFTPKINKKSRYLDERKMIIKDSTGLSVSRHDKLYLEVTYP